MPSSTFAEQNLRRLDLRRRFRVSVLALHRRGQAKAKDLRRVKLRVGEVLLLQGAEEDLNALQMNGDLWVLDEVAHIPFRCRKGIFAVAALLVAILAGSLRLVPLSVGLLMAALAVVTRRCITARRSTI